MIPSTQHAAAIEWAAVERIAIERIKQRLYEHDASAQEVDLHYVNGRLIGGWDRPHHFAETSDDKFRDYLASAGLRADQGEVRFYKDKNDQPINCTYQSNDAFIQVAFSRESI